VSVGRIGGDEFAIITEELDETGEPRKELFERFRQIVFRPTRHDDKTIRLSGSAGICLYPKDAQTLSELLNRADLALFSAKRNGRASSKFFDESTLGAHRRRRRIEAKLPDAIRDELIVPVFQPIVSSHTRGILGVEVLARWHDKDLGHINPEDFVSAATDIGLVGKLDRLVFKKAASIAKPWIDKGEIKFLSFNASPTDVVTPGYATDFLREIDASGLPPSCICIEILESSLVEDIGSARRNLNRLREQGVQIALDDYGTGYSNLRALLDMPLDKLKIDKSLVSGIEDDEKVLDLVISLVQLGRALDLTMVAEGVETASQSAFIEGAGCPEMQGYYFSRPLSGVDMAEWLKRGVAESHAADSTSSKTQMVG
jgi:predicted signal transduction protein with EAL and GGDEF domain